MWAPVVFVTPQIKGLDQELIKYRNALKKAKGPTAANIKRRAMECLKRKKMYEQQRDQMAGQQFNIEQTSFAIDSIKDTATTVRTCYGWLVADYVSGLRGHAYRSPS